MKRYAQPAQKPPSEYVAAKEPIKDPLINDISVDSLIGDGLLALHREIKQLLRLGVASKLESANARDLRDHLKLLFEIKDRQNDFLGNLTDEQFDELSKKVAEHNDSKQEGSGQGSSQT